VNFDMVVGDDKEDFYRDLNRDMNDPAMNDTVVLYGRMHVWHMETPLHSISLDVGITEEQQVCLEADLHWLNVSVAGWR